MNAPVLGGAIVEVGADPAAVAVPLADQLQKVRVPMGATGGVCLCVQQGVRAYGCDRVHEQGRGCQAGEGLAPPVRVLCRREGAEVLVPPGLGVLQ